ncbi:UNVERIFIED_CONTAM: hypothetical protein FKN15_009040 [Acipenser sinensis]
MSKKGWGSHDEVRSRDGKVVLVKWFDNRSVVLASNFVGVGNEDEAERWEQKERRFVKIKCPEVVKKYNKAMGGVDKLDQLISLYRIDIWSRKWSLCMITPAFDVAVVNSWLEYRSQRMPGHSATANHGSPRLQNDCGRSTCARGEAPRIEKMRESEQFQHTQSVYESNSP